MNDTNRIKICSYNLYGVLDTPEYVPNFDDRLKLLREKIDNISNEVDIFFFQEVNCNNIIMLKDLLADKDFVLYGEDYSMTTEQNVLQYNIIAVKHKYCKYIQKIICMPHGLDEIYKDTTRQFRDYGMSDYRTTLFVHLSIDNSTYVLGNIHTDYISIEGKIKGTCKSLQYISKENCDYSILLGDMNMISHMAECYTILNKNKDFTTLSKNEINSPHINSYHGYNSNEPVNVDFAFIPKEKSEHYTWNCICEPDVNNEGSDHRPVIVTIDNI